MRKEVRGYRIYYYFFYSIRVISFSRTLSSFSFNSEKDVKHVTLSKLLKNIFKFS